MTRPAMGDERRWAARYQFLEQLWRGRDRLLCDRELEAVLHAGGEGALAELLGRLIPGDEADGRAWVALHNDRRAASFARSRAGTVFVSLDEAVELASDEDWQIALVNLDDGGDQGLDTLLEVLGERSEDDEARSVVLTQAVGSDEDQTYEQLAELVEQLFGDGRIYGLSRPAMAAFYDFGPVLEPESEDAGAGDEGVGVEVDNSLGSDEPRFELFVAVVGAMLPGEGVTFVELPSRADAHVPAGTAPTSETEELAALRVQLAEAQRSGDMQAIERQRLLEQLEQAEERIASLDEELEALADGGESGASPSTSPSTSPFGPAERLDEALAREQSLRWELERLRGELDNLRVRPVEALEAELAGTAARLQQAEAELEALEAELAVTGDGASGEAQVRSSAADEPSQAQAREWMKARATLDHLLRKLERGGALSALELHRELSALRKLI